MLRVFVAEFMCSTLPAVHLHSDPLASIRAEGQAMLIAICRDLNSFAEVVTVVDTQLPLPPSIQQHQAIALATEPEDVVSHWLSISADCNRCLIIAPETDKLLASAASRFRKESRPIVACDDRFLQLTTDKLAFSDWLNSKGIPHPKASAYPADSPGGEFPSGWIVKPRDGCGSQDIRCFDSLPSANRYAQKAEQAVIVQPHCDGEPVSIAAIVDGNSVHWLPATRQHIDAKSFQYQGGSLPLRDDLNTRAQRLAEATLSALPGQAEGYIGFDLLLGDTPQQDVVIEVNPRLTTSYIGLRHLMKSNLAAKMLSVDNKPLERSEVRTHVSWTSEGTVTVK